MKKPLLFSEQEMLSISEGIASFTNKKVLVVGDVMLDLYTSGKIKRISPEAPVPVFHVQKEEYKLGGAANAALNIKALGASVTLLGRVGDDVFGSLFIQTLENKEIKSHLIFKEQGYETPLKNRILADNQQVIRIDRETVLNTSEALEQKIMSSLKDILKGIDLIAISDYGKGFLTPLFLSFLIETAKKEGIPLLVDPKGTDFGRYLGVDVLKPNLSELYAAASLPLHAPIEEAAFKVLSLSKASMLMVTRSEEGISLFYPSGEHKVFKAEVRKVKDVTGAGDTVLALCAVAMAAKMGHGEMAQLANLAAGIAIEEVGCAVVSLSDLVERFLSLHVERKIFKKEHIGVLSHILKEKKVVLISVEEKPAFDVGIYKIIEGFEKKEYPLLLLVPESWDDASLHLASLLPKVNYIVEGFTTISSIVKYLSLESVYSVEGDTLEPLRKIQDLFKDEVFEPAEV